MESLGTDGEAGTTTVQDAGQGSDQTLESAASAKPRDWMKSLEREEARNAMLPQYMLGFVFFAAGYAGVAYGVILGPPWFIGAGVACFLISVPLVLRSGSKYRLARIRFEAAVESNARDAVDEAVRTVQEDMSLPNLIALNRRQLEEYHTLTKSQANTSYLSMQIATLCGLLLLVGGGSLAVFAKNTTAQVIVGVLTGLGTSIAGYIGQTFLKTYRLSLEQLNFYFRAPLIASYALSAERVASQVSDARRDDVFAVIVDRLLSTTISPAVYTASASNVST